MYLWCHMWNRCIDVWENRLISSEWEALDLYREDCVSVSIRITAIMSSPLFSLAVVLQISLEILFPSSTYISEVFKAAPTLTSIPNKLKTDKWMSGTEQHDISWQMLRSTYGLHDHSLKRQNLLYAQSQPGVKNCGVATLK